jgi:hypothetical protein
MAATPSTAPKPLVYTPLPDEELNAEIGFIGHLNGVGVYSRTELERDYSQDEGEGPNLVNTTVYALEVGGVWNVDEWGDCQEYPDYGRDDAPLLVQELEELGWATIGYETVHTRLDEARQAKGGVGPAGLHLTGFRQWGFEVRYTFGVTELFWCDPGQDEHVAQERAAGYRQAGHTTRLMSREVGKAQFYDSTMYAEPNEAGRCRSCDGTTGVCQKCRKPMHGPEAGHQCSALPCRNCNGGSYPVRNL